MSTVLQRVADKLGVLAVIARVEYATSPSSEPQHREAWVKSEIYESLRKIITEADAQNNKGKDYDVIAG